MNNSNADRVDFRLLVLHQHILIESEIHNETFTTSKLQNLKFQSPSLAVKSIDIPVLLTKQTNVRTLS
ncbi:hypothetical protein EYC80_004983 [Monilinia laxa]|uniref:Uncharacterized protein n=1 Tax=Monilinia laxa TaxID=61186 RepID=A0A5N6KIJ2_MONLA|nr:hypothetical protein EYC80_004983 [Monilinia laxa]